ncbi:MAG TPA: PAS domain S-box protein, partial [Armatimonadota bacterium]
KGWVFVAVTAILLYGMIQRHTRTLQHTQAQLQESEAWYRRLITTAEEGIWVLDARDRVTFVNQRLADLLGYSVDAMLGRSAFDFIDPDWHTDFARHLARRQQGSPETYESCLQRGDGEKRWVIASATPIIDTREQYIGSFAMLTDITERHQLNEFQREFTRKTIEAATEGKLLIRTRDEVMQLAGPPIIRQTIARVEDLEVARHVVSEQAGASGMDEDRLYDFILCVSEATTNAIKHANGGMLSLHCLDTMTLLAVIADQGPGIQAIHLPEVAFKYGYTTAVSLGMGYKAMIALMDHVYLATDPGGTTVAIALAVHAPPAAAPTFPGDW